MAKYKGTGGGTAPPVIIDATGLTTTVPLVILNAKTNSGVEVQVTGTAASGFVLNDSAGVQKGSFGLAVSASDWITNSASNDVIIRSVSGHVILKALGAAKGVKLWSPNNTGANAFFLLVDDSTGVKMGYSTVNTLTFDSARAGFSGPVSIDNTTSLTAVSLQVAGDVNTGLGAIGGTDTISTICGGVEVVRNSATISLHNNKLGFPTAQTQATIGANGAAAALTALPVGYFKIDVNGTAMIVPYYNA